MKKKVLLVSEATVGGAYKHLLLWAEYLPKEIFDVSLVLSPLRGQPQIPPFLLNEWNVKCIYIPMKRSVSLLSDLKAFSMLYKHMRKEHYDIVHFHSSKAGFLGRCACLLHAPARIIYTPHCYYFQGQTGFKRFFFKKLEQFAAINTNTVITLSEGEKALTLKENITKPEKIVCTTNALPPGYSKKNRLQKDPVRGRYNISDGALIVAGIGRLTQQKGWGTFLRMAHMVLKTKKNVVFMIVGDGEDYRKLMQAVNKYEINSNVVFTGNVENMHEIYRISDVVLNTSLWESCSYVILEAMAYGIPIVATNIPGNNDFEALRTNQLLFDKNDYSSGVRILNMLLEDNSYRETIGQKMLENFNVNNDFSEFIKIHKFIYTK